MKNRSSALAWILLRQCGNTITTTRSVETPDTRRTDTDSRSVDQDKPATWGPWLFGTTLVVVMVFFWWLVIYSHGVTGHG